MGVQKEIQAWKVREGDDSVECLSVVVSFCNLDIRTVVAYGPQMRDSMERKDGFWSYLDQEVIEANNNNMGLIIQMDSNCHAGENIIPGDPNEQNTNGKLLELFLQRNQSLSVVNGLSICSGLITRQRRTTRGYEKAASDLFIVCDQFLCLVTSMMKIMSIN